MFRGASQDDNAYERKFIVTRMLAALCRPPAVRQRLCGCRSKVQGVLRIDQQNSEIVFWLVTQIDSVQRWAPVEIAIRTVSKGPSSTQAPPARLHHYQKEAEIV